MEIINSLLWSVCLILLIVSGIYFSFKIKFLHLDIIQIFKSLKGHSSKDGISPFESLMVSLGGCIGVGSLAGIALAIFKGGVGTIFWIMISICLSSKFRSMNDMEFKLWFDSLFVKPLYPFFCFNIICQITFI